MAYRWSYVSQNVVERVEKMRLVKNPPRFLSQEEIDCLLDTARDYYIYPPPETALVAGMRKSKLFNLKWTDIDSDRATITVQLTGTQRTIRQGLYP